MVKPLNKTLIEGLNRFQSDYHVPVTNPSVFVSIDDLTLLSMVMQHLGVSAMENTVLSLPKLVFSLWRAELAQSTVAESHAGVMFELRDGEREVTPELLLVNTIVSQSNKDQTFFINFASVNTEIPDYRHVAQSHVVFAEYSAHQQTLYIYESVDTLGNDAELRLRQVEIERQINELLPESAARIKVHYSPPKFGEGQDAANCTLHALLAYFERHNNVQISHVDKQELCIKMRQYLHDLATYTQDRLRITQNFIKEIGIAMGVAQPVLGQKAASPDESTRSNVGDATQLDRNNFNWFFFAKCIANGLAVCLAVVSIASSVGAGLGPMLGGNLATGLKTGLSVGIAVGGASVFIGAGMGLFQCRPRTMGTPDISEPESCPKSPLQ